MARKIPNEREAGVCSKTGSPVNNQVFSYHNSSAVLVLAGSLPLDLQVEKEYVLTHVLRLNRDLDYGPIHFCVDEIQRDVDKFRQHPATAPTIDWEEASP